MISAYLTDPEDHLVMGESEPEPPQEPKSTHKVTFNGHFRIQGTHDECVRWLEKRGKPMNWKTILKTSAYELEEV